MLTDFQIRISDSLEQNSTDYYPALERQSYSTVQYRYRFEEILDSDVKFSVFSILFVLLYMWFHLGSLFLSVSAMVIILVSFPVAQCIYRGIFQVTMYGQLNKVAIFVVIGIAAANVFVFCDAWPQSEYIKIMEDS